MKRITIILAALGAVAAMLVPTASPKPVSEGRPAASFYTRAALDAWGRRLQAQAQYYLTRGSNDRIVDSGAPAASFDTPESLDVWGQRLQAQAQLFVGVPSTGRPAASFYTRAALDAWGQRMQAQAQFFLGLAQA